MNFPKYAKYKNAGAEWIGQIPEHWGMSQSRRLFSERISRAKPGARQLTASQKHGVIYQDDFVTLEGRRVVEVIKGTEILKTVEPNDFVISMRSFQGGIEWCGVAGAISSAYVMLVPGKNIYPQFFKYLFKSATYIQALQTTSNLVRDGQAMRFENFSMVPLPVVPINEQKAIADFLDREIAKIDVLAAEQESLIALLKEKRQSIISHAVTKGLDSKSPMKQSGIDWMGKVPINWEIKKASLLFVAKKGTNAADLTKEYCATIEGEFPVYSGQTENNGIMSLINTYEFDGGDAGYLFSTTVGAKAMTVSHLKGKFSLSQNCMVIIGRNDICVRFYFYHLQQLFLYQRSLIPDHMQPSFRMEDLYSFRVALPPREEQERISMFLDVETERITRLIDEADRCIELLRERRSSIISAAVTGQIDVRGFKEKEPA